MLYLVDTTQVISPELLRQADNAPPTLTPAEVQGAVRLPLSATENLLSLTVLAFGLCLVLLEVYLITKRNMPAESAVKFVTITLIVIGTLFLISAGYDNNQIAPAMGLLGTIAGYLLGKAQDKE